MELREVVEMRERYHMKEIDINKIIIIISSPRPRPRREKHLRMNKESPKLLGGIVEDHPVLSEPGSWKEKAAHLPRQPFQSSQTK